MNVYDISANRSDVAVVAGGSAELELTVTNTSGRPSTAIVSVSDRTHGAVDWLAFEHEAQRSFGEDETGVIPLRIATTPQALPGDSLVTVLVASEHNPDEDFATFDLALKVEGPEVRERRLWQWWLLGALGMLLLGLVNGLLIGWATAAEAAAVPDVVGSGVAEATEAVGEDFDPSVVPSAGGDLDGETFRRAAAAWTAEIREALWVAADLDPEAERPAPGDARWRELAAAHPQVLATHNELGRVWAIDPEVGSQIRTGSGVELRSIPPVSVGPDLAGLGPLEAVERLGDAGLRFHLALGFPEGYRYGDLATETWIWELDPPLDLVPERTRVLVRSLPEHVALPDFTRMPIDRLRDQVRFRLRFLYHYDRQEKRLAESWADLRKWLDVQQLHGRNGFVYRQDPPAGTLVPTKDHVVTVFVDTRTGPVAAR